MQGGMDFPDDTTTNVFRVGDIREIHWTFHARKLKDEPAWQYPLSSEEGEDLAQCLQSWEYRLREDRRHVILDKDKVGLWVFSLGQAEDEGIAPTSGLDGLECTSVGSIRSADLVALYSNLSAPPSIKSARSAQSTATTSEELNTQAYGSNVSVNAQPSTGESSHKAREATQDHSVFEVYSNFTSAVSRSLSYFLGKRQGWRQLGPHACIDARTLGDALSDNLELHSWIATTTKLSFDVKWLSSGIILISFFQVRLPRLTRMSKMLSRGAQSTGLAIGSPLLLSHSGTRCHYLGMESSLKSDLQRKSAVHSKASVISHLSHQGIRPMRDVTWILVQMSPESNDSVAPPVSLWPAELCFCEDSTALVSSDVRVPYNMPLPDGSVDPLKQAESWFLGKSARIEALRVRALEENEEAQVLKDVEDTDDEDALSPFEVPVDQGITPQDVSGIYPTPPDGLPPALLGSSNTNNGRSGDYDDEEKDLQASEEPGGDCDGQENDDLFEDMDIDMFASNALTDADFSFFDEPSIIDEDLRETGQVMAVDDTSETTDHAMTFDGQGMTSMPDKGGDSGLDSNVAEDQGDVKGVQGRNQVFTDDNLFSKIYDTSLGSAIEDVDYGALKRLSLRHGAASKDADGGQRGSFEHVSFQGSTTTFDDKYSMRGRFAFDVDELQITKNGDRRSHSVIHHNETGLRPEESPMEDSVDTDDEEEDATASEDSDLDEAMSLSLGPKVEPTLKRKREQLDENDHLVTPSSSIPRAESPAGLIQNKLDEALSEISKPDTFEQARHITDHEAQYPRSAGPSLNRGHAIIDAAQLIAHQAVSGLLQPRTDLSDELFLAGQNSPDQSTQTTMTQVLRAFFPTNKRCTLKEYAGLGEKSSASRSRDQLILNSRNSKPPHLAGGLTSIGRSIFKLDSPYTRVRRNGVSTEISASALSFWEELSLGPAHEPKDIDTFCVCPKSKCIEEGVMAFLGMIKGAYQSCNLGTHDLGASLTIHSERIVTVPMEPGSPEKFLQDIAAACERFGSTLPELGLQNSTTVIYIINPFKDQQYLPRLVDALSRLPNSYRVARGKRRPEKRDDFVMQIIPLDLVWSPEVIVVPSPAEYRRLAFEIYNQCASSESGPNWELDFIGAPAICLAKAIPKTIDFKLASESSVPLMQSDNCVHVSYAWDNASEWLVAVWTDNLGVLSWRACYCLGRDAERPWKPFYEVAKEIFESSFVMLQPPNAPWHLFVCKDRPMLKQENDVWLRALADSSRPSLSCTFLTVDANPRETFTYSDLQTSSPDVAPALLATPGATPQTNTPSPDIPGLGSTPVANAAQVGTPPPNAAFGDHDSEAKLVDITDETWGVIMDGTLEVPRTLSDSCTSVACGFLVKRAGPRDENGLIPLGVNLVHGQKPYRGVLKEVLGMYRNLGTLARVRGIVDPVKSVLPLHVAAARKAWKAVSETMRYGYD